MPSRLVKDLLEAKYQLPEAVSSASSIKTELEIPQQYAETNKAMRKLNFGENSPVQNCDVFSTLTKNFIGFADINFSKCACSGPNTHERYSIVEDVN